MTFFEKIFVNVDDAALKTNRLTLLKKINQLYSKGIADLSRIPRK
jgi:glycyl-tRNA synthetase beta subunit